VIELKKFAASATHAFALISLPHKEAYAVGYSFSLGRGNAIEILHPLDLPTDPVDGRLVAQNSVLKEEDGFFSCRWTP
jgi:hypothetical protein